MSNPVLAIDCDGAGCRRLPALGGMRAKDISRRDVRSFLERKAVTAPILFELIFGRSEPQLPHGNGDNHLEKRCT